MNIETHIFVYYNFLNRCTCNPVSMGNFRDVLIIRVGIKSYKHKLCIAYDSVRTESDQESKRKRFQIEALLHHRVNAFAGYAV